MLIYFSPKNWPPLCLYGEINGNVCLPAKFCKSVSHYQGISDVSSYAGRKVGCGGFTRASTFWHELVISACHMLVNGVRLGAECLVCCSAAKGATISLGGPRWCNGSARVACASAATIRYQTARHRGAARHTRSDQETQKARWVPHFTTNCMSTLLY